MKKLLITLAFLVIGLYPQQAHAACTHVGTMWTAASAVETDVRSCLNAAIQCGDTVVIPNSMGTVHWSTRVLGSPPTGCSANQGFTITGVTVCNGTPGVPTTSCTDSTVISLDSSDATFDIGDINNGSTSTCSNTSFCYLTALTFINGAKSSSGQVQVIGTHGQVSYRLYHFHFLSSLTNVGSVGVEVGVSQYGLIDHMLDDDTAVTGASGPIRVNGDYATQGYRPWTDVTNPGSNEDAIIEDSTFNFNQGTTEGIVDGYAGCKVTFRYNVILNNEYGGWHGTDSGGIRGCVMEEIYNNTFTNNSGATLQFFNTRSGTLFLFNNVLNGSSSYTPVDLQYFRILGQVNSSTWGTAGPAINWTPVDTNTSTGCGNTACAALVTLNAPDWQASHSYTCSPSVPCFIAPSLTNPGSGAGQGGFNFESTSNCTSGSSHPNPWTTTFPAGTQSDGGCTWTNIGGSTLASPNPGVAFGFCVLNPDTPASSNSTCNALSGGDTATRYFDANGGVYPFRDQPGRVHNQVLLPNYEWNNTGTQVPSPMLTTDSATATQIVSGRDFFLATPAPSYTPYTYPDPLQGAAPPTTPVTQGSAAAMFVYNKE